MGMHTFEVLSGHSYSVAETITAGSLYEQESNNCINLMPEPGKTVECTILNEIDNGDSSHSYKQSTLNALIAIGPTGNDKADKKIAKAIVHVQKSLDPVLWFDNTRLDPQDGKEVFHEEEKAVKQLLKIKNEGGKCEGVTKMTLKYIGDVDKVRISVPGLDQKPNPNAEIMFSESGNGKVKIDNDGKKFGSNTEIVISNIPSVSGGSVIETFTIDTSCSTPLAVHDIYGTMTTNTAFTPVIPVIPAGIGSVVIDKLDVDEDGMGDYIDEAVLAQLLSIADTFVAIDRELKDTAMSYAADLGPGNEKYDKHLEKAMKEAQKGDDKRDDGKLNKAIHHYEKAWKHAQMAINEMTP